LIKLHLQALSYSHALADRKLDLPQLIDLAADTGWDGIDLEERLFESTDPGYTEELRQQAYRRGLGIGYIGIRAGFGSGYHGTDEDHLTHMMRWTDVCQQMGIPLLRIIGGDVPAGQTEDEAWPWLASYMRRIVDYAKTRRVQVGLHNHNHGMFPATGAAIVRMLDEIDDPYFVHIMDTGQYRGSPGASGPGRNKGDVDPAYDFYHEIETSLPRAQLVRCKAYKMAGGREEWINYDRIFPMLKRARFNGVMSIVYEGWESMPDMEAMPIAHDFFRGLLHKYGI
jgi:sugar phosphate isomerase/epimerase